METIPQPNSPKSQTLSVIVPVYNESTTIGVICDKVSRVLLFGGVYKEITIVNDCSSDNTDEVIAEYKKNNPGTNIVYIKHDVNRGKGAALSPEFRKQRETSSVQDADLEYDPTEYNLLLKPILDGFPDVVYGSRFIGGNPHRILFWHTIGNRILTLLSNMANNLNLSDMETCYKLFRAEIIKSLELKEDRFGFEPEVTAKIARLPNIRLYEVGISYYGRTYKEGKKINWKDGIKAFYCIIKYGLMKAG